MKNPDLFITVHNQNFTESEVPLVNQAITIHIGIHLINQTKLNKMENNIYVNYLNS